MRIASLVRLAPSKLKPFVKQAATSPLLRRIGGGIYWSLIGTVGIRFASLVNSVIIARQLGIEDFGRYGIVQSTLGTIGFFAGLGMGLVTTKYIAELITTDRDRASRIFSLTFIASAVSGLGGAIMFFIAAPWISRSMLGDPSLEHLLRLTTPLIALGTLNGVQTAALSGFQAFRTIAKINILVAILMIPTLTLGALVGGLAGVCIGLVIINSASCLVTHIALSREARRTQLQFSLRGALDERKLIYHFALPALLAGALVEPVHWYCATIITNQPNGFREIGAYYAAMQWGNALTFLPSIFGQVVFPVLSEAFARHDRAKVAKLLTGAMFANGLISVVFLLGLGASSHLIMGLYGGQAVEHWLTFVLVIGTAGIVAVQTPVGLVIAAANRMWIGLVLNLGWALALVTFTHLLADRGSLGLAGARAGAYALHAIWTIGYAFHVVRLLLGRHG
jgi:O-antigen/teichoic acid export membrane protein